MKNKKTIKEFFSETPKFLLGVVALLVVFNVNILTSAIFPEKELSVDSVAQETIKSPKTIYFRSKSKTEEAQERAAATVGKIYEFDSTAKVQQESKALEILKRIETERSKNDIDVSFFVENVDISEEAAMALYSLSENDWQEAKKQIFSIIGNIQENEELRNDEDVSQEKINNNFTDGYFEESSFVLIELVRNTLVPNRIYSDKKTKERIIRAKEDVEQISLLVVKDEVIISSGEVIDELTLEKLEAVGIQKSSLYSLKNIGNFIISLIFTLIVFLFFRFFYKKEKAISVSNKKAFYLFVSLFIVTVFSFEILIPLKPIMAYLFPVAAPIILLGILLSPGSAFFAAVIFSFFLGGIISGSVELVIIYFVTSLVGIYKSREITQIIDIFKIGIYLFFFNFISAIAFHLMVESFNVRTISVLLGAAAIYGLGSSVLVVGTLMFWGRVFKITTLLDLLELENPQQKILKDLSIKAPGTYHHSVLVSNLAQKAAKDIGAHVLLCGVGALYHDIGKINNPSLYIENQKRYNVHDKLKDPVKSAELIKSHVSEGIEIAKSEKIPSEVTNFIESHHGTSEVFYFLKLAKENNIKIDYEKFRYQGPLPKTKEATIIMIADSIEAKSRAESSNLTSKKIKEIVAEIIDYKEETGQLKEAPLRLDELEVLKKSFSEMLGTMNHKRIKYDE